MADLSLFATASPTTISLKYDGEILRGFYANNSSALDYEAGHLTGAPELVVEVLSPGEKNEKRDRESKLKLYSVQGVQEYWICDRIQRKVEVYRREQATLKLAYILFSEDELTSPLLPGFHCLVSKFF